MRRVSSQLNYRLLCGTAPAQLYVYCLFHRSASARLSGSQNTMSIDGSKRYSPNPSVTSVLPTPTEAVANPADLDEDEKAQLSCIARFSRAAWSALGLLECILSRFILCGSFFVDLVFIYLVSCSLVLHVLFSPLSKLADRAIYVTFRNFF